VWRTVVFRQIIKNTESEQILSKRSWSESVQWVTDHPEKVEEGLYQADQDLDKKSDYHLILLMPWTELPMIGRPC